ncbi:MAG: hypothetical protein ABSF82_03390 [Candidatus Bathyarchaeia archaeon]|jgi:hypothetical protein
MPLLLLYRSRRIGKIGRFAARTALWISSGFLFFGGLVGVYWIALAKEEILLGIQGISVWDYPPTVSLANGILNDAAQGLLFGAALGIFLIAIVPLTNGLLVRVYERMNGLRVRVYGAWKKIRLPSVSFFWEANNRTELIHVFVNYGLLYGLVMLTGIYYSIWPASILACQPSTPSVLTPYVAYVEFLFFAAIAPAIIYEAESWKVRNDTAPNSSETFARIVKVVLKQLLPLSSSVAAVIRVAIVVQANWLQFQTCIFGKAGIAFFSIWSAAVLVLFPFIAIAPAIFATFGSLFFVAHFMRTLVRRRDRFCFGVLGFAGLSYFVVYGYFSDLGFLLRSLSLHLPIVPWASIFPHSVNAWMLSLTPLLIGAILTLMVFIIGRPTDVLGLRLLAALVCSYFLIVGALILLPLRMGFESPITSYPSIVVMWIPIATAIDSVALIACFVPNQSRKRKL